MCANPLGTKSLGSTLPLSLCKVKETWFDSKIKSDPVATLKSKVLTVCPKTSAVFRLKFILISSSWTHLHPEAGEPTLLSGLHPQDLPWRCYWSCHLWWEQSALHACLWQQYAVLKTSTHSWATHGGRDGRCAVPTFEKESRIAIQGELLGLGKSKASSFTCKFSLLFYVLLMLSVVWPLHDEKGWRSDMTLLKDFITREYSRTSLMPAGSSSWRHQGSSGRYCAGPGNSFPIQFNKARFLQLQN